MRNENKCVGQTWPYTYMGFKDQNVVFECSFEQITFFGRERGEKAKKRLWLGKYQVLGGIFSHFLLLRDQATYKGRFEEI